MAEGVSSVQNGGIIETFPILRRFVRGNLFLVRGPQSHENQYLLRHVCLFHLPCGFCFNKSATINMKQAPIKGKAFCSAERKRESIQ